MVYSKENYKFDMGIKGLSCRDAATLLWWDLYHQQSFINFLSVHRNMYCIQILCIYHVDSRQFFEQETTLRLWHLCFLLYLMTLKLLLIVTQLFVHAQYSHSIAAYQVVKFVTCFVSSFLKVMPWRTFFHILNLTQKQRKKLTLSEQMWRVLQEVSQCLDLKVADLRGSG